MDIIQDKVNKLEERSVDKLKHRGKKTNKSIRDMWDMLKRSNICRIEEER